ncbi:MAG: amidohydrolase family protein [Xanthobacteraceae bacterium]|nr:amidohydrolase family protein [Xanthobacteraceae bacterium]
MSPATDEAPFCLPPRFSRAPTSFAIPRGAWDTHAHVIGGGPAMPFVAHRNYTPPPQTPEEYVAVLDTVGLDYGIAIQISVHGNDNRLIAEALAKYPSRLRGVVSIDGSESDAELIELRDLGVCGIRVNEHFAGGSGADQIQQFADRCRPLGWHVDLGLNAARLRELSDLLHELDITLVIDHLGFCPARLGVDHPDFVAVLDLVRMENCWIKLSGAYRLTQQGAPYDDVGPFYRALCEAAPTRTIWGADWPNVALFDERLMPEIGEQLDALHRQIDDLDQLHAILVDNPARLYGIPGTRVLR